MIRTIRSSICKRPRFDSDPRYLCDYAANPFVRFGNRYATRTNAAPAYRRWNAPRDHSGSRGLSLACAAFVVNRNGLLRIGSCANERAGCCTHSSVWADMSLAMLSIETTELQVAFQPDGAAWFALLDSRVNRADPQSAGQCVTVCNVTRRNVLGSGLTRLQQAILDRLWSGGPATAEQVREALVAAHPLKDSTVRTLLRRLEARGYVSHRLEGKTFVYEATMAPTKMAARSVRQIIDRFWAGSVEQFLTGMVDEKILTAAEVARLGRKIHHAKRRKNTDA